MFFLNNPRNLCISASREPKGKNRQSWALSAQDALVAWEVQAAFLGNDPKTHGADHWGGGAARCLFQDTHKRHLNCTPQLCLGQTKETGRRVRWHHRPMAATEYTPGSPTFECRRGTEITATGTSRSLVGVTQRRKSYRIRAHFGVQQAAIAGSASHSQEEETRGQASEKAT